MQRSDVESRFTRLTQASLEIQTSQNLPKNEAEWRALATELTDLVQIVVTKLLFLSNYDLIRILEYRDPECGYELYKGLVVSTHRAQVADARFTTGWFYWSTETRDALLLHPLLIFWNEELGRGNPSPDVGIYDRLIYERMQYFLSTPGRTATDAERVQAFIALVFDTIEQVKRQRVETERLTWWQLRDICRDITSHRMASVSNKYSGDLHLPRVGARSSSSSFYTRASGCSY